MMKDARARVSSPTLTMRPRTFPSTLALALITAACAPSPPATPPVAATTAATAPPATPPPAATPTAAPPAPPAASKQPTIAWKVELAQGAKHEVRSLARLGGAIWAAGWYGNPTTGANGEKTALPLRKGDYDPFLARLDGDGKIAWQGRLDGAGAWGVAASTDGALIVGGEFVGEIPGALVPRSPVVHAFVSKIDPASGRVAWTSGPNTMDIEH